jgi:hypothetical protein
VRLQAGSRRLRATAACCKLLLLLAVPAPFAILAPSSGAVFPLSRNDGAEDANYALQHSMPLLHDSVA